MAKVCEESKEVFGLQQWKRRYGSRNVKRRRFQVRNRREPTPVEVADETYIRDNSREWVLFWKRDARWKVMHPCRSCVDVQNDISNLVVGLALHFLNNCNFAVGMLGPYGADIYPRWTGKILCYLLFKLRFIILIVWYTYDLTYSFQLFHVTSFLFLLFYIK